MKMRVHDDIDVLGPESRACEARQQRLVCVHERPHDFGESPPAFLRIIDRRTRMARVEQHVTLLVSDQRAAEWRVWGWAAVGLQVGEPRVHAKPAGGEKVEF